MKPINEAIETIRKKQEKCIRPENVQKDIDKCRTDLRIKDCHAIKANLDKAKLAVTDAEQELNDKKAHLIKCEARQFSFLDFFPYKNGPARFFSPYKSGPPRLFPLTKVALLDFFPKKMARLDFFPKKMALLDFFPLQKWPGSTFSPYKNGPARLSPLTKMALLDFFPKKIPLLDFFPLTKIPLLDFFPLTKWPCSTFFSSQEKIPTLQGRLEEEKRKEEELRMEMDRSQKALEDSRPELNKIREAAQNAKVIHAARNNQENFIFF